MSKESSKSDFDENQAIEGFINGGMLEYDAGVIQTLGSNEEIIRYGMLAPSSPEAQKLTFILYEIMNNRNISDAESDYLDSINSRFIGHLNKKDLTNREILCLFLNQYWDWSALEWVGERNVSVSPKRMFSAYSKFCKDNKFDRNTRRLNQKLFLSYLLSYGNIKRSRESINNRKLNNYIITNLPAYKESLTEIPEFDIRKFKNN